MGKFSHIDDKNKPKMVNVIDKKITKRRAVARAKMFLGKEIINLLDNEEINTKKGPVFPNCHHRRNSSSKENLRNNSYVSSITLGWNCYCYRLSGC